MAGRKHSFGFSSEDHETRAHGAAVAAKQEAASATRKANDGRCAEAFTYLRGAHRWKGRLTAEIQASARELVVQRKAVDESIEKADAAFWRACARKVR